MSGLCDKVVVVTGAARGMGRAHCERFADAGADVIAIDVPAAAGELRDTATEVEKRGRRWRSLAKELAPHNIRVNTVHPTNVDTPMIQNEHVRGAFRPDLEHVTREQFAESARSMNMLPIPWVEPVDVAHACLFLASDEARYITSVTLPVDAGSTQR